jgi:hypothetical protein
LHHRGDGRVDVAEPLGHGKPITGEPAARRRRLDLGEGTCRPALLDAPDRSLGSPSDAGIFVENARRREYRRA